jgi:peptidoglycan L-alanyl-D-glutamate endopeptidase CwlK
MDKVTLQRIETAHPAIREELKKIYAEICAALTGKAMCRFAYVKRTDAEQDELFAQGRTKPGPNAKPEKPLGDVVTWAKAGESYHNYGLAVDIVLVVDKDGNGSFESASWDVKSDMDGDGISDWMEVIQIFTKYGWTWGGNWNKPKYDAPHLEKTMGYSIMRLKELRAALVLDENGYVKLSNIV